MNRKKNTPKYVKILCCDVNTCFEAIYSTTHPLFHFNNIYFRCLCQSFSYEHAESRPLYVSMTDTKAHSISWSPPSVLTKAENRSRTLQYHTFSGLNLKAPSETADELTLCPCYLMHRTSYLQMDSSVLFALPCRGDDLSTVYQIG